MQPPQRLQQHNVSITESKVTPVKRKINEHDENLETIETEDIILYVDDGYAHRTTPYNIHVVCDCGVEMGYFNNRSSAETSRDIHLQQYENY